jgi:hypothetical protein
VPREIDYLFGKHFDHDHTRSREQVQARKSDLYQFCNVPFLQISITPLENWWSRR